MECNSCTGTNDFPRDNSPNTDKGGSAVCPVCNTRNPNVPKGIPAFPNALSLNGIERGVNFATMNNANLYGLSDCDRDHDSFRTGFRGFWSDGDATTRHGKMMGVETCVTTGIPGIPNAIPTQAVIIILLLMVVFGVALVLTVVTRLIPLYSRRKCLINTYLKNVYKVLLFFD